MSSGIEYLSIGIAVSWCFEPSQPQRITSGLNTSHVFEPIYILRALNMGTCIQQGDLFYSVGLHRNHVLATADTGEIGRGFGQNADEWWRRCSIQVRITWNTFVPCRKTWSDCFDAMCVGCTVCIFLWICSWMVWLYNGVECTDFPHHPWCTLTTSSSVGYAAEWFGCTMG